MNWVRAVVIPVVIFGVLLFVTDLLHFNLPWKLAVFTVAAVPALATCWAVHTRPLASSSTRGWTVADAHPDVAGVAR